MNKVTKTGVGEQSSPTVTIDQEAENLSKAEALADEVIADVPKISSVLNKVKTLKMYFDESPRDGNKRLKVPIKGCYTWGEFCLKYLDRGVRAIQKQLAAVNPKPKKKAAKRTTFTSREKAAYDLGVTRTLAGQAFCNGTDTSLGDYNAPKVINRLVTINTGTLKNVASAQDRDLIVRSLISALQKYLLPTSRIDETNQEMLATINEEAVAAVQA